MKSFWKKKRVVDEDLLEAVRNLPCMGRCASTDPRAAYDAVYDRGVRSHPHHLESRGSGGGDVPENVMPLCFRCHSEVHAVGLSEFSDRYATVKDWLELAGWGRDERSGDWIRNEPNAEASPELAG